MLRSLGFALVALLWATSVWAAAPTFDAASSSCTASGSSITVSHTMGATANGIIFAFSPRNNTSGVTSVTWNGSSTGAAQILARNDGAGEMRMELWRIITTDTGTHNLVVNYDGGASFGCVTVVSLIGMHQTTPATASASNSDTSGSTGSGAGSITVNVTSNASELVVGAAFQSTGGNTYTSAGSGQTERIDTNDGSQISGTMATQTGASTTTHSYTASGNKEWVIIAASIQGTGGGASTTSTMSLMGVGK